MAIFSEDLFVLLALLLALLMTGVALYSYFKYEAAVKLLKESRGHVEALQHDHDDFRIKTSEAFADRKEFELRIQSLERSLGTAHEEAQKTKDNLVRVAGEHQHLKTELESTRENLRTAYASLREREREVFRLKEELARDRT